jgi:heme/copper-type cytochrome/quinol oxidase subunit 3
MKATPTIDDIQASPTIPNGVLGMGLFVAVEILFFLGLLSAYFVTRASAVDWPPEGQPTLPLPVTVGNTFILLASGYFLFKAGKVFDPSKPYQGKFPGLFRIAFILGAIFLLLQGREWIQLIQHGLTLQSSLYGSSFYVIVGSHAAHVLGALLFLGFLMTKVMTKGEILRDHFMAAQVFWYFVVGIWPLIFFLLYVL